MKKSSTFSRGLALLRRAHKLGGLALALGLAHPAAQAQTQTVTFPRNAPFTGTDPNNFTLGGAGGSSAYLTAGPSPTGEDPIDKEGEGVLRLTKAVNSQAGYAIDNYTFDTPDGFSISFEFFSYGTTSEAVADGFTVFLVNGDGTMPGSGFAIGGFGGSLGYANRYGTEGGVTKGYLGIGIDAYGNYGIPSENKTGGYPGHSDTQLLPNAVTLRGPYDPNDPKRISGYGYIAGSNSLDFNLAVGTSASNPGSRITDPMDPGYRKAYVNVIPVVAVDGSVKYRITVRIQHGQQVKTTVSNVVIDNPPPTLRVGFGASTGGKNSIQEIRGLAIVQAPIANDDYFQTKYNQPINIGVLNNDTPVGETPIKLSTVDIDPSTIGRDTVYYVPQGKFSVNDNGIVKFSPNGRFSGVVSVPYTVLNFNENLSNPGTINIVVTGAEVQTIVSGQPAVRPGQTTSYAVTTINNGNELAQNVLPMLTLPAGFTVVGSLPADASTTTDNNGIITITFAQTTLSATQHVDNIVQVMAAADPGPYTLASNYQYPSDGFIPDSIARNNASTLAVTVDAATPLPVQLTTFSAVAAGADALLTWETAQEINNRYFAIERSLDGVTFASIGKVAGKGTTTQASAYSYVDAGASARTNDALYYRLRQVDDEGKASFSGVKAVHFRSAEPGITLYPNPSTGAATLDLSSLPAGTYLVQVFEATGRLVHQATYQPGPCLLPVQGLATGTYFVKVQGTSYNKVLPLSRQ